MNNLIERARASFYDDFTASALKAIIVGWAIFVMILVLYFIDNKWILAGILAYEVLP